MTLFSARSASAKPVVVDGDTYYKSDWMTSGTGAALSPTVFLVEQLPNVSLRTHFHRNNQFQLFVRGSGTIGRHRLEALMVHYAGAYSGYGPIVAGPEGLAYFTLRSVYETGSLTPTTDAAEMKRGPKRQLHSDIVAVADDSTLASTARVRIDELIPSQPDGVAAQLLTLPPNASATGRDPAGAAGQFFVVVAGAMIVGDERMEKWRSAFVSSDDPPLAMRAAEGGLLVACLQLPHKADEYRDGRQPRDAPA